MAEVSDADELSDTPADTLRFVIDKPAVTDTLKTHAPVAVAIARAISDNPSLKIVGLLGRWGSGKSTIVGEVGNKLSRIDQNYRLFTYDAWLHQHDSHRRSFLETIVGFLGNDGAIDKVEWEKRLSKLSGSLKVQDTVRVPTVTVGAKIFVVAVAIMSFGFILAKDTFKDAFADHPSPMSLPVFRISLILIFFPVLAWIVSYAILRFRKRPVSFFPSMFLNRELAHVNSIVRQDIEPTSLEFGRAFRDLMKEAHGNERKVVIVVDNLDRLSNQEAMGLWAGIRSFFLSTDGDNDLDSEDFHPTVIVPVDYKSISQMFSIDSDERSGEVIASSFINKTFDVTFGVPSPVMSDWKAYLREKMVEAFGHSYSEEKYFRTRQFLESWFGSSRTPVTPREINKAINGIIALLMQWGDSEIPYELIAYFAINRRDVDDNIRAVITAQDHPLSSISDDWQRQLAALHYGVSVDHAGQVLMAEPIRAAFLTGDAEGLKPYQTLSGFEDQLESATRELPSDEGVSRLQVIANAAAILSGDSGAQSPVLEAACWRNLVSAYANDGGSGTLTKIADSVKPIISHTEAAHEVGVFDATEALIDRALSNDRLTTAGVKQAGMLAESLLEFAVARDFELPVFDVAGDAEAYLSRLASLSAFPDVQRRVRSEAPHEELIGGLNKRISSPETAPSVPLLLKMLTSPASEPMIGGMLEDAEALIDTAENLARSNAGDSILFRSAMLTIMASPTHKARKRAALERLAADSTLQNNLAAVANVGDVDALAVMLAALVWKGVATPAPAGARWTETFGKFPGLSLNINNALDNIINGNESQVGLFVEYYDAGYKGQELASALFEERVNRGRLGSLYPDRVLERLYVYTRVISWRLRDRFTNLLAELYNTFTPSLKSVGWSEGVYEAALRLSGQSTEAAIKFRAELIEKLHSTTAEDWSKAVLTGDQPYKVAKELIEKSEITFGLSSKLFEALINLASDDSLNSDRRRQARWFEMSFVVTSQARKKAMETLGQGIQTWSSADKLHIMKIGGTKFISDSKIFDDAKSAVDAIILPLAKSAKGRSWLRDRKVEVRHVVARLDTNDKRRVRDMVQASAKAVDPDRRHWGETVKTEWSLK